MSGRPIDYDRMVAEFEQSLVTTLRGHAPIVEYLETWVPDTDPISGLLNMLEAAEVGGCSALDISVSLATFPQKRHGEFLREAADIADVAIEVDGDRVLIRASEIGAGA